MKPKEFLDQLDDARVVAAIRKAEGRTSGEICIFVSSRELGDDQVEVRATARFHKLGMEKTRDRNGVLLYFIPRDRKYAIIGDRGIHEKCGSAFWREIATGLDARLAQGEFTDAVVDAIVRVGDALATHFPRGDGDLHEFPDEVARD